MATASEFWGQSSENRIFSEEKLKGRVSSLQRQRTDDMPKTAISFNVPLKLWEAFKAQADGLFLSRAVPRLHGRQRTQAPSYRVGRSQALTTCQTAHWRRYEADGACVHEQQTFTPRSRIRSNGGWRTLQRESLEQRAYEGMELKWRQT